MTPSKPAFVEEAEGWQPIETAPKDGTWVWVRREPDHPGPGLSAFVWDEKHQGWFAGYGWWQQHPGRFIQWHPLLTPEQIAAALEAAAMTPCPHPSHALLGGLRQKLAEARAAAQKAEGLLRLSQDIRAAMKADGRAEYERGIEAGKRIVAKRCEAHVAEARAAEERARQAAAEERGQNCRDVCMYCGGRAMGYSHAQGPNNAGNFVHYRAATNDNPALCAASAIYSRARAEQESERGK